MFHALKSHVFVIGCVLVSFCSHARATESTLLLGETQAGSISSAAQTNSYTFSADAGDVVDFTMTTTSGKLSPKLQLYDPAGKLIAIADSVYADGACTGASTIEMNTVQIPATGTYTLDVSDCSDTNTGAYESYAQSANHPAGAENLPFGRRQTGVIDLAAQSDTYTFSANVNDEIDFTMVTTSGTLSPKIRVYKSDGTLLGQADSVYADGACTGASTIEMNTLQIPKTGIYTVLAGDCSDTNTGYYDIYAQRTDHPPGPANLLFGQTQSGKIGSAAQSNTYAFSANVNDEIDFTMVTTSGTLSPKIRVYKSDGTLLGQADSVYADGACTGASTIEMNTLQIPKTGVYTVLAGDCSDTNTGAYNIYAQRANNTYGLPILAFGPAQTGLIGSPAQSNTYIFSGSKNEVLDFTVLTTTGTLSPKIRLYNPNGTLLSQADSVYADGACTGSSSVEMNTVTLTVSGTYTLLFGDCSDRNTGNYAIYAQSTNDPFGPAPLLWGQVQTGNISSMTQSNTYTFSGTANNSIDLKMAATSGSLSPKIRLYNPDGTLLSQADSVYADGACTGGSTIETNSIMLPQDGDYTVLVGDCSDTNTGKYNLSSQCFGACPVMPAIIWPTPAPITYGTTLSATQLDATVNVAGTFVYSPASGTLLTLGPHNLSVKFTPDNTKYSTPRDFVQLTVNRAPTSTMIASSADPSRFGQAVTFTATVRASGVITPTGAVTFKNGSSILGTGTLSSGKAKFSTSALSVASHSITAVYGGSADFIASTSSALTQTVKQAPTSTSLASSLNPSRFAQSVTFTAIVRSNSEMPTGTVIFKNGSATLGTGTISSGKAKFTTSTLAKGAHSITAVYEGSTDFLSSTSPALIQTVN